MPKTTPTAAAPAPTPISIPNAEQLQPATLPPPPTATAAHVAIAPLGPEALARREQQRQEALRRLAATEARRRSFGSSNGTAATTIPTTSTSGPGGGGSGSGGGSTVRETNSKLWSDSHRPSTPHVTKIWQSSRTATVHVWYQHYECCTLCLAQGGPNVHCPYDRPHCYNCLAVHLPAPDSPFCGDKCAAAYFAASSQSSARHQLFDREMGVCQQCGFNGHSFFKRLQALPTEQARMQALMSSPYSLDSGRLRRMLTNPKEGDFWEADHIVPVAEGGGESDLSNFQTLCTPCHAKKTREQERRAKEERRAAFAEGTADLRTWFQAG